MAAVGLHDQQAFALRTEPDPETLPDESAAATGFAQRDKNDESLVKSASPLVEKAAQLAEQNVIVAGLSQLRTIRDPALPRCNPIEATLIV